MKYDDIVAAIDDKYQPIRVVGTQLAHNCPRTFWKLIRIPLLNVMDQCRLNMKQRRQFVDALVTIGTLIDESAPEEDPKFFDSFMKALID